MSIIVGRKRKRELSNQTTEGKNNRGEERGGGESNNGNYGVSARPRESFGEKEKKVVVGVMSQTRFPLLGRGGKKSLGRIGRGPDLTGTGLPCSKRGWKHEGGKIATSETLCRQKKKRVKLAAGVKTAGE